MKRPLRVTGAAFSLLLDVNHQFRFERILYLEVGEVLEISSIAGDQNKIINDSNAGDLTIGARSYTPVCG